MYYYTLDAPEPTLQNQKKSLPEFIFPFTFAKRHEGNSKAIRSSLS